MVMVVLVRVLGVGEAPWALGGRVLFVPEARAAVRLRCCYGWWCWVQKEGGH